MSKNIKFLATNGAHGAITTLGKLNCGIEIFLTKLNSVEIASDGTTMTVGGGIIAGNLTRTLYDAGKQAVTGTCECVSYLGPALGGGHGWLQGYHGLIADQFVSLDIVLANGSLVTVTESGPDPELFWALKGAGHNFGIVTSATSKIFDIAADKYALSSIFISGDNVKQAYEIANSLWLGNNGADNTNNQPVDLAVWSYWFYEPTIDTTGPVVVFYIIQAGVDEVDSQWTTPFDAVNPIMTSPDTGTYLDLAAWTGIDFASTPCNKTGNANNRFPVYLPAYNGTAMEQAYALFKYATAPSVDADTNTTTDGPFPNSLFMAEGYSMQGVKAIDSASAAFAFRDDNLLIAPLLIYPLDSEGANEALAYKLGTGIRDALRSGSPGSNGSYVNYSYGDETTDNWYGSDAWRQDRLRSLKSQYDPQGRFSFYGPIA